MDVDVEAPSLSDAQDLVEDTFGPGEDCGVTVTSVTIFVEKDSK